jgi:hypothetical protein
MKASKLIERIQEMIDEFGDLEVTLHMCVDPNVPDDVKNYKGEIIARSDDIFVGKDGYKDEPDKIDIRSFWG